jgi:acetyltransferase-like isoleucine patch superfamily enzyme
MNELPRRRDGFQQLTPRNIAAMLRYLRLRIRHPRIHLPLFFLDRGGEVYIGPHAQVKMGKGIRCLRDFTAHWAGEVVIGEGVFFNYRCYFCVFERVEIGANCLFGEGVSIHDENHDSTPGDTPISKRALRTAPISIGSNVWVGAKATILPGVTIGDWAVIGAGAVVTRDIPPYSVAVGVPARVIRVQEQPNRAPDPVRGIAP